MTTNSLSRNNEDKITVTNLDFKRLSQLIQNCRDRKNVDIEYLTFLSRELQRANKIDSKEISPNFVTMNSIINVTFLDSGKTMDLRLVYPQNANFSKGLISILSPLGCALLGYESGDIVTFVAPKGEIQVKINDVIFQPESNGEDLN
jgi:regulator of nucleoside diphosphate kinase